LLRLLRKHRRNCPVNGIILVIPADSLLGDTAEAIEEKAKKLANTIHRVQRDLDVRFPIIIWITKCDLIPGFRSYFDSISNADRQHQMLGWSNPEELDTPFQPNQISRHMETVIDELRQRRWSLLEEVKVRGDSRKIDAVDGVYSFPANFERIVSSLQRYLELMFVSSRKAPFLRGIYFNSAVTQGQEVDKQLAEAMGIPFDEFKKRTPTGGVFVKTRAFFIRDSLAKKLFLEQKLVTHATLAIRDRRRKQWLLAGAVTLGVAAMVAWAWFATQSLKDQIGDQAQHWQYFAAGMTDSTNNLYLIDMGGTPPSYAYRGQRLLPPIDKLQLSRTYLEYYSKLVFYSTNEIHISPIFGIFSSKSWEKGTREAAWRTAFKTGILVPILRGADEKLRNLQTWRPPLEENALMRWLRWEGAASQGAKFNTRLLFFNKDHFLGPIICFLGDTNQLPDGHDDELDRLTGALDEDTDKAHLTTLVPFSDDDFISGTGPAAHPLKCFLDLTQQTQREAIANVESVRSVADSLGKLQSAEGSLLNSFASADSTLASSPAAAVDTAYYKQLENQYSAYLESYQAAIASCAPIPQDRDAGNLRLLGPVVDQNSKTGEDVINKPFQKIQEELVRLSNQMTFPVYGEALNSVQKALATSVANFNQQMAGLSNTVRPFDNNFLMPQPAVGKSRMEGRRDISRMEARRDTYRQALLLLDTHDGTWYEKHPDPFTEFVGARGEIMSKITNWISPPGFTISVSPDDQFEDDVPKFVGKAGNYLTNYWARQVRNYYGTPLRRYLRFPVVQDSTAALSVGEMKNLQDLIGTLRKDVLAMGDNGKDVLNSWASQVYRLNEVIGALTVTNDRGLATPQVAIVIHTNDLGIYRYLRLNERTDSDIDVRSQHKSWNVRLDGSRFILEYSDSGDKWNKLITLSGDWAPLRFILDKAKPDGSGSYRLGDEGYEVQLNTPDGKTTYELRISLDKCHLPYGANQWPKRADFP
jgi:hypothetical protein